MRPSVTFLLIMFNWNFCCSQNFSKCKIFQFLKGDSSSINLVCEETYNSKGQLITQYHKNYKNGLFHNYMTNRIYFYSYRDTLLAIKTYVNDVGDSSKTTYEYNSHGKLLREQFFEFKSGNKVWKTTGEAIHKYDNNGNEVYYELSDTVKIKIRTSMVYDDSNRMIELNFHTDFEGISTLFKNENPQTVYSKDKYKYFGDGYIVSTYHYNYLKSTLYETPIGERLYKLNDKSQEIEKRDLKAAGDSILRRKISYNNYGKIARKDSYNINGDIEVTDIYYYE